MKKKLAPKIRHFISTWEEVVGITGPVPEEKGDMYKLVWLQLLAQRVDLIQQIE